MNETTITNEQARAVLARVAELPSAWDAASDAERPFADRYAGYHAGVIAARAKTAADLRAILDDTEPAK